MPTAPTNQSPLKEQRALSFFDVLRFVGGYWRRQKGKLSFCVFLYGAAAILETNLPNALAKFLGAIRLNANTQTIILCLALFIGNYYLQVALRWVAQLYYNKFETQLFKDLMHDAFAHVHRMSEQFFANNFTGSIISKITRARTRIEPFEDHIFHRIIPTAIILVSSTVILAARFPLLAALVAVYFILLLGISILFVVRVAGPVQTAYTTAQDVTTGQLADGITGIATTKSFAQEDREIARFKETLEHLRIKNFRTYFYGNMVGLIQNVLLGGMLTLLLGGGTWYFLHGKANVEDMAYLTMAYTILQSYLRDLSYNVRDLLTASYDLHAAINLLQEIPQVADADRAPNLHITTGTIEFQNVSFTYAGRTEPIFKNFSLTIKAGERIALVGHSGSGKSTFLRLLQRAYDVQSGAISIDGQNIATHTLSSLRRHIALVPQDPILFHRTLRENIAYARPDATMDEILAAARQAHIDHFIDHLPEGYETMVGERGVKLSGGERQRIAIARALLANRPILILDEATSSLDSVSEKAVQDALHVLIQRRTSIMVAHRLSTILDADRILVFDRGVIMEEGTHAELLARHGLYAEFFALQSGGYIGD